MFTLKVDASFEAAHRLTEYNGPCSRLHGHSYVVQAGYKKGDLDKQGMAIDLVLLKKTLRQVVGVLDHQNLNTVISFPSTAENLARYIFGKLRQLPAGKFLDTVAVEEVRGAAVVYREDKEVNVTSIPHAGD